MSEVSACRNCVMDGCSVVEDLEIVHRPTAAPFNATPTHAAPFDGHSYLTRPLTECCKVLSTLQLIGS